MHNVRDVRFALRTEGEARPEFTEPKRSGHTRAATGR
jgi:hypothetical protein